MSDWVTDYYADVDALRLEPFVARHTEDAEVIFGNQPPTVGIAAIHDAFEGFWSMIGGMRHEVHHRWDENDGATVILEVTTHYTTKRATCRCRACRSSTATPRAWFPRCASTSISRPCSPRSRPNPRRPRRSRDTRRDSRAGRARRADAGPARAGHRVRARVRACRGPRGDHPADRAGRRHRRRAGEGLDAAAGELPAGTAPETWAHLAIYRARPDVGAAVRAQPESAFAASAIATELVPLHGQASWLGRRIPVHGSARLLRDRDRAEAAADTLADADAVLLRGNGALTVGADPGRRWPGCGCSRPRAGCTSRPSGTGRGPSPSTRSTRGGRPHRP